jgi:hypothetical protein
MTPTCTLIEFVWDMDLGFRLVKEPVWPRTLLESPALFLNDIPRLTTKFLPLDPSSAFTALDVLSPVALLSGYYIHIHQFL